MDSHNPLSKPPDSGSGGGDVGSSADQPLGARQPVSGLPDDATETVISAEQQWLGEAMSTGPGSTLCGRLFPPVGVPVDHVRHPTPGGPSDAAAAAQIRVRKCRGPELQGRGVGPIHQEEGALVSQLEEALAVALGASKGALGVAEELRLQQLCRYGGEEFLIYFSDSDQRSAKRILDELNFSLSRQKHWSNTKEMFSVSFSSGLLDVNGETNLDTIIKMCDELLYRAKREGRARVASFPI